MAGRDPSAHYKKMAETPVSILVPQLAVPSIITMIISSVYNMADTFFVSQLGTSASGAVGIVFSLMAIIQAIGFTLGTGSGSLVARYLGAKRQQDADTTASVGFFSALAIGGLLMIGGTIFRTQLVRFLGATDTNIGYAEDYATYILFAAPLMCTSFQMNNVLRSEGKAALGTCAMTAGGLLNMALDPLFIFVLDLGIAGAAIATALSQCVSFSILLFMYLARKSSIRLRISYVFGNIRILPQIIALGFPSLCRQGLASMASVLLNRSVRVYGDTAIAAMNIVSRVTHFQGSVMRGLGQGSQPVTGFSYGAKQYSRVYEANRFTAIASTVFMALASVVIFIWAPEILTIFRRGDPEVIRLGTFALRANCIAAPLGGLFTTVNMSLQSTGKTKSAIFLAACRQGIFFLPLIAILPGQMGLVGAQLAQPLADGLTFLVSIPFCAAFKKDMLRLQKEQEQKNAEEQKSCG